MKNLIRIMSVAVLLAGASLFGGGTLRAQDEQTAEVYRQAALESFVKGKYNDAQEHLKVYKALNGSTDQELQRKISMCIYCLEKAEKAKADEEIDQAITYYKQVLDYNPEDKYAKQEIELLEISKR